MSFLLRRSVTSFSNFTRRAFHSERAEFTTIDAQGLPATEQVDVCLGEPHEAYVIIPKHVGKAITQACAPYGNSVVQAGPDTYPLVFDYDRRHFFHKMTPFPRLAIPQDLPRRPNESTSPATLFVCGPTDVITLNGTADFEFFRQSGESFRRLKPSLDNLKDR